MSGKKAAKVAIDAATSATGNDYSALSASMCWSAVVYCQVKAGAPQLGPITFDGYNHVISRADPGINTLADLSKVPEGAFIGFFVGDRLIHAMLGLDDGRAAGNKNSCIGIGRDVGWEILNLADLPWNGAGFADHGRAIEVHYRALFVPSCCVIS